MDKGRIRIQNAGLVEFLTDRMCRKNCYENWKIESYFKKLGVDWSHAITRAKEEYDENQQRGKPLVYRAHYEIDASGRISVILQGKKDQCLARYAVENEVTLKKQQTFL